MSIGTGTVAGPPHRGSSGDDVKAELVRYIHRQAIGAYLGMVLAGCILTYAL
jgi:hypothetical protein